jgi:hypothetical protein
MPSNERVASFKTDGRNTPKEERQRHKGAVPSLPPRALGTRKKRFLTSGNDYYV